MRTSTHLALCFLVLSACGKKQSGTYEVASASGDASAFDTLKGEADALWEKRGETGSLEAALAKYEQAYNANPTDRETAGRLTRGWYFLGDAHRTETDAKNEAFDTAVSWGKRCLAINADFKARLEKGDEKEVDVVDALGAEDVPCMYWTSSALGKWAKLNGILTSLKHIDTVKGYMGRIGELQPDFFYHGPDRYWGAYYSLIPSFSGRDLDKSKSHFDKSIAGAPEYLGTQVLVADTWAVNSQDKATYTRMLQAVIDADPGNDPDIGPENRAEQAKAKRLLAQTGERFAD
jgi:tetratricopeptide (TPR) repeat protein